VVLEHQLPPLQEQQVQQILETVVVDVLALVQTVLMAAQAQ
jgi:hypothetical protein